MQKESKEKQVTGENEEEKKGNSQMKTERKKDKKDWKKNRWRARKMEEKQLYRKTGRWADREEVGRQQGREEMCYIILDILNWRSYVLGSQESHEADRTQ